MIFFGFFSRRGAENRAGFCRQMYGVYAGGDKFE